jgi:secondary thiamine-phosphate synthase enzyme
VREEAIMVRSGQLSNVITSRELDVVDLTQQLVAILARSGVRNGTLTVTAPHTTAGLIIAAAEPGGLDDLVAAVERAAPREARYQYHGAGTGHGHVRAALVGCSVTLPVIDGRMVLGEHQRVVLIEFDFAGRQRRVIYQVVGE